MEVAPWTGEIPSTLIAYSTSFSVVDSPLADFLVYTYCCKVALPGQCLIFDSLKRTMKNSRNDRCMNSLRHSTFAEPWKVQQSSRIIPLTIWM